MLRTLLVVALLALDTTLALSQTAAPQTPPWPEITRETKPWTRWWWMGSAVTESDLTANLEACAKANLGGMELTPIYGVAGNEQRDIPFLTPRWMTVFDFTLKEAERLDLGVDIATGTGWPFGGPWVNGRDACKYVAYRTYTLKGGETLSQPVRFNQETIVRSVGTQVYHLSGSGILAVPGEAAPTAQPPPRRNARELTIDQLVEPISANKNLQALALDQIRFPKPLPLQALIASSDTGKTVDLTRKVDADGNLSWKAPEGNWTLYAVFMGWHGKMVERAAPGGEGNVIDHFSRDAIRNYLRHFDRAFQGHDIGSLRGFFNDSYEVDDARGQSDWTPDFFREFERRRGYDLREQLPSLFSRERNEKNARVLCDYRETISDLLLDTFTTEWGKWARGRGKIIRNQAHGSPAHILDLYAASDIPETEGTDLLRVKFASSAANVTGRKLTSSESATWLNEHFTSTLADVKRAVDRYFLGGVNHIFYHGTCYSPVNEPWPGFLFYAAVHFNPRNSWWQDFGAFNQYVARCQSFLQSGRPGNDTLLYLPIYDSYSSPAPGDARLIHYEGMRAFERTPFQANAEELQRRGYTFDLVSDRQLQNVKEVEGRLQTGGVSYQTVIVPRCRFMPLETFEKLVGLAKQGATVIALDRLPEDVPGFGKLEARRRSFQRLTGQLTFAESGSAGVKQAKIGEGAFLLGNNLEQLLAHAGVKRESLTDQGLQFVRRNHAQGRYYFIANWGDTPVNAWVPLQTQARSVAIFNPMHGQSGYGSFRVTAGATEVYLQLAPGESLIVDASSEGRAGANYAQFKSSGPAREIEGRWNVSFVSGGPDLPANATMTKPGSWTELEGDAVKKFSGTARYSISFPKPAGAANHWVLDLGSVRESARVRLNGKDLGTLLGPGFTLTLSGDQLTSNNLLEVEVSNLMANRIADLDKRNVPWKKFYNVNFPARVARNRGENGLFDASRWEPMPSGLIGPVTLAPAEPVRF